MNLNIEQIRQVLPTKRWFGEKGRNISAIHLIDLGILHEEADSVLALGLVDVGFEEGPDSIYHLPLLIEGDSVRDATEEPERLRILGEMLAHGHPIKGEHGIFHFSGPGLDPGNPPGSGSVRTIDGEQSNTSVVFDDSVILKFFRKVEPGTNPDLELTRVLTNEGFRSIPEQLGEIFYEATADAEVVPEEAHSPNIDLGIAQRFIHGGREGWTIALDHIGALFDQVHEADVPEDRNALVEERAADILGAIEQLGDATATMHVTLAREDIEPELRPEPVIEDDLRHWSASARALLAATAQRSEELSR
ncbi:MAG: maltokinase N-terminal cap-like domain-containing protein, partial [Actinomycetota bacterium]